MAAQPKAQKLLAITTQWATSNNAAALGKDVAALLDGLDNEALVEVFKVLPRQLTMPHFARFQAAEKVLESTDVSTLLVSTNFEDCGDVAKLGDVIAYALSNVQDDVLAPHGEAVFQWRLKLCTLAPKGVALDGPAKGAMVYAINAPNFFNFETISDTLKRLRLSDADAKSLAEFIDTVLLEGAGTAGHDAFVKKAKANFFASLGVTAALRKAQLLSLCRLLSGKKEIQMADLASGAQVSTEAAEGLVVDAALANIIDVEVNRSTQKVSVQSVMPLRFDANAMKALLSTIDENVKFVDGLIREYA